MLLRERLHLHVLRGPVLDDLTVPLWNHSKHPRQRGLCKGKMLGGTNEIKVLTRQFLFVWSHSQSLRLYMCKSNKSYTCTVSGVLNPFSNTCIKESSFCFVKTLIEYDLLIYSHK